MQRSKATFSVLMNIIIVLLLMIDRSDGDPRTIIRVSCNNQKANNQTQFSGNFIQTAEQLSNEIQTSLFATASTGTGQDATYALFQCYGSLSTDDCILCYDRAHYASSGCFPYTGGIVHQDGCFMRFNNYSFYEEYAGPSDTPVCVNTTRKSNVFQDSARRAVANVVSGALINNEYFAREETVVRDVNSSVYVLAECWKTLSPSS